MDIKYEIQIVHDVEVGYSDPLRAKIIPDFSIRSDFFNAKLD